MCQVEGEVERVRQREGEIGESSFIGRDGFPEEAGGQGLREVKGFVVAGGAQQAGARRGSGERTGGLESDETGSKEGGRDRS